jgi:hypothetical protein
MTAAFRLLYRLWARRRRRARYDLPHRRRRGAVILQLPIMGGFVRIRRKGPTL